MSNYPERIATPRPSVGSSAWIAAGVATLLAVTLVTSLVSAVITWFAQSLILGSLGAMGLLTGLVLLGVAVIRETNAYRLLATVNGLRALLQARTTTPAQARTAAQTWLGRVATRIPDLAGVETAIADAQTVAEVRAVLRSRVADPLEDLASGLGRRAAAEGAALVAVSPHNSWDGIVAALRGLLLIRQVAALCGLRPGLVVTASLVKHVAWTAVGTSGAAALSQSMADYAVTDMPIIKHLAGAAGAAGVQAFRLHRLAKVTAEACCPVPR